MLRKFTIVLLSAALSACATAPFEYPDLVPPRMAEINPVKLPRPVIGLVLGAGGARGFAHVGVIKTLEGAGIIPDVIVGSSSGAIVASLYAGGYDAARLEDIALHVEDQDLIDFTLFGPGFIQGERLQDFVNRALGNRSIEVLQKPFAVIATAVPQRVMTVFNRGNVGLAVRASASVPNLFWPVLIKGREYVDGGLTSRLPAPVARRMGADVVIAVDVSRRGAADAGLADIVIRPDTARTRILDFDQKLENIAAGEMAAHAALPYIRELIALRAAEKSRNVNLNRVPVSALAH